MTYERTLAVLAVAVTVFHSIRVADRVSLARSHRDVRGMVFGLGTLAGVVMVGLSTVIAPAFWLGFYQFAMRLYAGQ